jgi:hypothetical protein
MISQMFGLTTAVFAADNISLHNVEVLENTSSASLQYVSDFEEFDSLPATFSLDDKGIKATGWIGVNDENITIRVVVNVDKHAAPDEKMIWDGDSIEFCFDMSGDGTHGMGDDALGFYGKDDAKFLVALARNGVIGMCVSGKNNDVSKVKQEWFSVVRDDESKETIYELQLPWSFFETFAGIYPNIGLALQVNNMSEDLKTKDYVKWGKGTYGPFRPGLFKSLQLPDMGEKYSAIGLENLMVWDADNVAKALLVIAADTDAEVSVKMGDKEEKISIKASPVSSRYALLMQPDLNGKPTCDFDISITSDEKILVEQKGSITLPGQTYNYLISRLTELADLAEQPLLVRHFESIRSLVESEWARLQLYREEQPLKALETNDFNEEILAGLYTDAATWEPYVNHRRNLIFAYVSQHDRSVQYYHFALPNDWDAEKEYPFYFELHGAGNDNPLSAVSSQVTAGSGKSGLFGYSSSITYAASNGLGYYCQPFGRGNLGYQGIAEIDIFEAYNDVHKNFKIDLDRQYLYGFSMGGSGTWMVATRTPDLWAAVAMMAGATSGVDLGYDLGKNLSEMPTFLWCGESDRLFRYFELRKIQLEKFVNESVIKTTPELGHSYIPEIQKEVVTWMSSHVRKRPAKFFFLADTAEHLGVWGIKMKRDIAISGIPQFSCAIDGTTVVIDSKGTPELSIELGNGGTPVQRKRFYRPSAMALAEYKGGLGLSGDVKVIWNGKEAYNGPAKKITLSMD